MPISIIIPAHNEEAVIERCLTALTCGARPGELDVIVVCNGCTDRTAQLTRAFIGRGGGGGGGGAEAADGGPVRIIETDVPSKSNALNLGYAAARGFPRFYADADVRLTLDDVRRVADALRAGPALAAAPRPVLDMEDASWAVRAYYGIDQQLPWFREGIGNAGVYALSQAGRTRFAHFPPITTDDTFVRLHFTPAERVTVSDASATVTVPATLRALIAIKTRSHFSKWEIAAECPELRSNEGAPNAPVLRRLALWPQNWPGLAIYACVKIAARLRCRLKYRLDRRNQWERDDTSRPAATPEPQLSTGARSARGVS